MIMFFKQKVGFEHQLYNRKLRETPKVYSTAAFKKIKGAAGGVIPTGW